MKTPSDRFRYFECPRCKYSWFTPGALLQPEVVQLANRLYDPKQWQIECEEAVVVLSNVLADASRSQAASAVIQMLKELPQGDEILKPLDSKSLLMRCWSLALERQGKADYSRQLNALIKWVAALSPARRALLEASVAGTLIGYVTACRPR